MVPEGHAKYVGYKGQFLWVLFPDIRYEIERQRVRNKTQTRTQFSLSYVALTLGEGTDKNLLTTVSCGAAFAQGLKRNHTCKDKEFHQNILLIYLLLKLLCLESNNTNFARNFVS